jgi:hypothetical protein
MGSVIWKHGAATAHRDHRSKIRRDIGRDDRSPPYTSEPTSANVGAVDIAMADFGASWRLPSMTGESSIDSIGGSANARRP